MARISLYSSLKNPEYKPRILDKRIAEDLDIFGAVCLQGVKYCGKSWTGRALSNSEFNLVDPAGNFQNLEIASMTPEVALSGSHPRLIDEWQEVPSLWDGVRNAVDISGKKDTFILTGSSIPKAKQSINPRYSEPKHSGVGRIEKLRMRPMTLFESGNSNGSVSLKSLFEGAKVAVEAPEASLESICELVVKGGWPGSLEKSSAQSARVVKSYIEEICNIDISRVDGARRSEDKTRRLLHSLARNAEQATSSKTVIADMTETANQSPIALQTVNEYLRALKNIFIIEEIPSWAPRLRSPLRINKRPKYHFVDPSIPAAVLGATSGALMNDLETLGFLFECLCVRDLLVYAEAMEAKLSYYRDQASLEADVIIEAHDGKWAALEIKLGHNKADDAAKTLKAVAKKTQEAGGRAPEFLAVVEGLGKYAYRREDGVLVLPITCLAP